MTIVEGAARRGAPCAASDPDQVSARTRGASAARPATARGVTSPVNGRGRVHGSGPDEGTATSFRLSLRAAGSSNLIAGLFLDTSGRCNQRAVLHAGARSPEW
jgi:hypothetical protein